VGVLLGVSHSPAEGGIARKHDLGVQWGVMPSTARFVPTVLLLVLGASAAVAAEPPALSPGPSSSPGGASPGVAETPRLDAAAFARQIELDLLAGREALRQHGIPLETLLTSSMTAISGEEAVRLAGEVETHVLQLRTEHLALVHNNAHLFEEMIQELEEVGRRAHAVTVATDASQREERLRALREKGPGLMDRLRATLQVGVGRLSERLGAPPALIVSGGASVGSYQAGFLHYYSLFLQDRARLLREIPAERREALRALGMDLPLDPPSGFTLVTGASAGSVNALLAAYAGCREPERIPTRSLFFETWNTLSLETLLNTSGVSPDHMFSSKPVDDAIARVKSLEPSAWKPCRFSLGATTTRLERREIDLSSAAGSLGPSKAPLRLARFTEEFLLEATGGAGRAPVYCPFPGCDAPAGPEAPFYPRLIHPPGQPVPVESVFNMISASGAFPTAFAPRVVPHRYFDSSTGKWIDDEKTQFTDGGIYNNNPLGLAVRMARNEQGANLSHHRFLYIDPNATTWNWAGSGERRWPGPGLLSTFEDVLKGFVGTAVTAQLMDTLEAAPEVRDRLDVPLRHGLLAGEHLLWMSAFLDEDFRTFDFHRGMVDAWYFLTRESDNRVLFAELSRALGGAPAPLAEMNAPLLDCFLAFELSDEAEPSSVAECRSFKSPAEINIQSLMAITRKMRKDPSLSDQNKFERFTAALAERGYVFRSGLLKGQPASVLRREFRRSVGDSVDRLSQLQPASQQLGFSVATKQALDDAVIFAPRPFYVLAGFTSNGVEVAASPALTWWDDKEVRLRGGGRLSFTQAAPLSDGATTFALDTEAYVNATYAFSSPALKPLRLEAGLGAVTTATYLWSTKQWVSVRFAAEGSIAAIAAEHVEISIRPRVYLDLGKETAPLYVPVAADGPSRHLNAVEVVLGAGWRF